MLNDSDDRIDLSSLDQMTRRRLLERLQYRYPNLFCYLFSICSFVGSLLKSGHGAWIGLNDRSNEYKFLWNYNRYEKPSLFFWDKSDPKNPEPNNFNGHCNVETCVEMKYSNKKWNDVVCKAHIAYVCQKDSKTGAIYKLKKKENSNTRKLRKISRAPSENRTHDPPSSSSNALTTELLEL